MMKNLSTAIEVAADYALHLHKQDGVPKQKAIAAGAASVVRAVRATRVNDAKGFIVPPRRGPAKDAGVGFSGDVIMGAGSLLSAFGWIKNLVGG